ncbi:MAG: LamG-like jellyroll fold domain-containing protein [bacterium]
MPSGTGDNDYVEPNASAISTWRTVIQNILSGDYSAAHTAAAAITYQVTEYTDTTTTPNITYYILERTTAATTNYWGTFIYNPSPLRQKLFIQCPHPLHDTNTGYEGLHIFRYCGARAYYTSGTHRCNSTVYSTCDGTTTVCSGSSESYRDSDQAHVTQGMLHITTEELESAITDMVAIQPHGFSKGEGDPDLILSNGTTQTPDPDYLVSLKNNLTIRDSSLTFKIGHIDEWTRLLGTTNMQGRYINGIASPCNTSASSTTGRFLHVEQAYSKLRDNLTSWNKVVNAVAMTIPLDNVLTNDQILEFDGTDDYIVYTNDAALQKLDGASDYTLEAWVYIADENDIDDLDVIFYRENGFHVRLRTNLRVNFNIFRGGSTWSSYSSSTNAITVGQWNHIAVIRDTDPDPNTLKIIVNGSDVSSATWSGYSMQSGGGDLYIGRIETANNHLKGYVDEVRLKDNAEYPGNLHSTIESSPYSWDGNTAAIFHFDEGSGSYVTSNEAGHQATLGTSTEGDAAEPTWRDYDYLSQALPLPVELSSFTAYYKNEAVTLNWTTESEVGAIGFIIERRTDETEDWQEIASYLTDNSLVCLNNQLGYAEYTFTDNDVIQGKIYFYRLSNVDIYGNVNVLDEIEISLNYLPEKTKLLPAYPNPFNPQTKICYQLAEKSVVDVSVHNILGQKVRQLVAGVNQPAGSYNLFWNGKDDVGRLMSSGTYFIMFKAGDFVKSQKVLLMR